MSAWEEYYSSISQKYFDETCRENANVFDLTAQQAVQETVDQLQATASSAASSSTLATAKSMTHLLQSHPDSASGVEERRQQTAFVQALERLAATRAVDNDESTATLLETLQFLNHKLLLEQSQMTQEGAIQLSAAYYQHLFLARQGWTRCLELVSLLRQETNERPQEMQLLVSLMRGLCVQTAAAVTKKPHKCALQTTMPAHMVSWLMLLQASVGTDNLPTVTNMLIIMQRSMQQCERNKQLWTSPRQERSRAPPFLPLLLDIVTQITQACKDNQLLGQPQQHQPQEWIDLTRSVGSLLTAMCTFEDDWMPASTGETVVASAHATVLALSEMGMTGQLLKLWTLFQDEANVVLAIRCMAIHDSIVQQMVAGGVLERIVELLVVVDDESNEHDDSNNDNGDKDTDQSWAVRTAVIGLVRNLSANDEIKCNLCGGRQSIAPDLIRHMNTALQDKTGRNHGSLLEHACGSISAMALRFGRNAEFLISHGAAEAIVRSMHKYPEKVALQRQGALAIRNIVSRSPDLREPVLQAGAEAALVNIAARHQRCQDEVYAALRDLGIAASLREAEQDSSGMMVFKPRQMFGERNPNFRPVFD
jgi:hypothetical protein